MEKGEKIVITILHVAVVPNLWQTGVKHVESQKQYSSKVTESEEKQNISM